MSAKKQLRELEKLKLTYAQKVQNRLVDVRDSLRGKLLNVKDDTQYSAFKARDIISTAQNQLGQLQQEAIASYQQAAQQAVDLSIKHTLIELGDVPKGLAEKVSFDAAKTLFDPEHQLMNENFAASAAQYSDDLLQGVRREAFMGLRGDDSYQDIVKRATSDTGPLGEVAHGKAENLMRTEVGELYQAAKLKSMEAVAEEVPEATKVWVYHGGGLRPCPICKPLDGTEKPMDGTWTIKTKRKSYSVERPLAHPNCLCTLAMKVPK